MILVATFESRYEVNLIANIGRSLRERRDDCNIQLPVNKWYEYIKEPTLLMQYVTG